MPKAVEYIFTLCKDIKYFEFASYFYKKKYFFFNQQRHFTAELGMFFV